MPHETATMRGVAAATSRMFSRPSGVSVAMSTRRVRPSAGSVSALAIIFSLPPGTKCSERRRRAGAMSGGPLAHHRIAAGPHHQLAVLVARAVLEGHDAPLRPRLGLALVDHLGLGVD